jgi:DNA-binding XRE family transcriptional regulator
MKIAMKSGAMHGYCRKHDISRDELSRRMGVSTTTAFRVEKGDSDPSPKFIACLMRLTGLPFEELFEIVGEDECVPVSA